MCLNRCASVQYTYTVHSYMLVNTIPLTHLHTECHRNINMVTLPTWMSFYFDSVWRATGPQRRSTLDLCAVDWLALVQEINGNDSIHRCRGGSRYRQSAGYSQGGWPHSSQPSNHEVGTCCTCQGEPQFETGYLQALLNRKLFKAD